MPVRQILLLAGLLWAGMLCGCQETRSEIGSLKFGVAEEVLRLDPRYATDAHSSRLSRLVYARLVEFDDRFDAVPGIAHWKRLDARYYRFTLDPNRAPFHDGSRLTSADVKATYDHVLDAGNGSPHRGSLAVIERIEIPDDETVDFHLSRADPLFVGRLVLGILPARSIHQNSTDDSAVPVGSGPFRYLGRDRDGSHRLSRLRDGLVVKFMRVPNPTVRVLKLLRGELDLIQNDLSTELSRWLEAQPGVRVGRAPGSRFAYIGFNLTDPLTGDVRIRRAIAHAVDRDSLVRYLRGEPPGPPGMVLTPDHWASLSSFDGPDFSPDKARRLLAAAGYGTHKRPKLVYKTSTDPLRVRIASVIQQQLSEVGFDVEVRSYDWGTFYGDVKSGNFQMYSLSWVGIKLPDIFRYAFHSRAIPPDGANRGRLQDSEVDRLIDLAESSEDERSMRQAFADLQRRLWSILPYVPLWYEGQVFATRCDVSGYQVARDGNYDGLNTVRFEPSAAGCE